MTEHELADVYRDLHAHPELSFAEHRTAGVVAARLRAYGCEVTEGIGRTGVVGVLANGDGPVVALRADMDALPVAEATGLPYASVARGVDPDGADVPVMHACGHDMHVACLLGAVAELAAHREAWRGQVLAVFQPAEELVAGARAMVDDGLFTRFRRPDVVLGQHVAPLPAGVLGLRAGPSWAASDSLRIVLHGAGGHGSRPETAVDPVLLAAACVLRLNAIVSREIAATDTAVLTVGAVHAGTKANVIADSAELLVNLRSYEPAVRERLLAAVRRTVEGEAAASGAPRPPEVELQQSAPPLASDPAATQRTMPALQAVAPVVDHGLLPSSEDVGVLAAAAGAPLVFWLLGGADPRLFADARDPAAFRAVAAGLPSNHSPAYAPVVDPTLGLGVRALVAAAREWLA